MKEQKAALLQWGRRTFPVGNHPLGIAFDGSSVWVANNGDSTVTKLRASDGANLGTFPVGSSPITLAFDGSSIWVANESSNDVTKLRASDGANLGTFPVGAHPIAIDFDGTNVWVSNQDDQTLTLLRASDGVIAGVNNPCGSDLPGLGFVSALFFDGANMWGAVPSAKNAFLCTSDQSTIFGFQPTQFSIGLAFDGESLWVGDLATNSVLVRSWTRNQTIPGVFSPMGIAFDGSDMWVANSGNNTVTRIRASDGVPIASYTTGQNPWGVAFDGANVWVTNSVSNTVSKF